MEAALQRLVDVIEGLRADVRAAARDTRELVVMQQRTVRELAAVLAEFRDELIHLRTARDRDQRISLRLESLERAATGG